MNPVIISSCSPRTKTFLDHESSQQTANIPNTNSIPALKVYVPTAYVLQESIGVMNVSDITLHALRTIFQYRAELNGVTLSEHALTILGELAHLHDFSLDVDEIMTGE